MTVVVDPADYADVLENMAANEGGTTLKLRERLGIKVFVTTSKYDSAIANYLNQEQEATSSFSLSLPVVARFQYHGENPHRLRSTGTSTSTSRNSTARNFPIITSSTSPRRRS